MSSTDPDTQPHPPARTGRRPGIVPRLAAITAVLAAIVVRTFDIDVMSLWTDEGLSFYRAGLSSRGIMAGEIPLGALITRDVQPPAFFLLLAGWLNAVGVSVWAAKWLTVLASLPTVALVWAATRRWAGRRAAGWAAWLAALSPAYLWYAQEVRSYTLAITLGALATYAGWRALEALGLFGPAGRVESARAIDAGVPSERAKVGAPVGSPDPNSAANSVSGSSASDIGASNDDLFAVVGQKLMDSLISRLSAGGVFSWAVLAVAADALLAWTHYLGFFVIGFHAVGLFATLGLAGVSALRGEARGGGSASTWSRLRDRSGGAWWLIIPATAVALAASPLVPYAIQRLGTGAEKDQRFYPLWVMARDGLRDFALGRAIDHSGLGLQLAWTWWLMAALLCIGAWHMWRRHPATAAAALGWLTVPTLGFFAVTLIQPRYQGVRHILLQSPPYYVLVGAGIAGTGALAARFAGPTVGATLQRVRLDPSIAISATLGLIVVGAMTWADRIYYADLTFHKDNLRGLADHVRRHALPGDALVLSDPVLEHVLSVYDPGIPVVSVPPYLADGRLDDRRVPDHLKSLFESHERLWTMTPHDNAIAWLEKNAVTIERTAFRGLGIPVRVSAWEQAPDLGEGEGPPRSRPLVLGPLELQGWEASPRTLVAGQAGRVDLAWLVRERHAADIKVALRLLDSSGVGWAQGDHEPFHGLRPTSTWPFGEVLVEPHDLHVSAGAPPGSYTLAITVYDPATDEVIPSDGPYPIGEVMVAAPEDPAAIRTSDLPIAERLHARTGSLELVGWRGPDTVEALDTGTALPLEIWVRAGEGNPPPASLRMELVDSRARVARSTKIDVGWADAREGDVRRVLPSIDLPADAGDYSLRLRIIDAQGRPRWMTNAAPVPFPRRGLALATLRVTAPARLNTVPNMARRLDVPVGDDLVLLGADLPESALAPGRDLPVTLWWRADRTPDVGYHVTVQVIPIDVGDRPAGEPVTQHDGVPATGARVTNGWARGEVIEDLHVLALPEDMPAGRYALITALYDPASPGAQRPLVRQEPYGDTRDYVVIGLYTVDPLAPDSAGEAPAGR